MSRINSTKAHAKETWRIMSDTEVYGPVIAITWIVTAVLFLTWAVMYSMSMPTAPFALFLMVLPFTHFLTWASGRATERYNKI